MLSIATFFSGCQKKLDKIEVEEKPFVKTPTIILPKTKNPFSKRNVEKAQMTLEVAMQQAHQTYTPPPPTENSEFVYFKFNPQELSTEQFLALENDTTGQLLEIPFANMAIYSDDFALDEAKAEELKDGSIYGVTAIENQNLLSLLSSNAATQLQYLDTLVMIPEEDTALQYQAFREAGVSEEMLSRFRICLFKRPHGYVKYWDNQFSKLEPVRNMQVWSLFLGIPIYTYTRDNGFYEIPWRYSIGTIMGTRARNNRVTIKPLDTHGTLIRNIYTLVTQFIVGSVHIKGWVTPCQMNNDVDFNFYGHTQVRYWSQLLNAYSFHDDYCDSEGIDKAPNRMVCYAQWANTGNFLDNQNVPDFGNASTPMLGHISNTVPSIILQFLTSIFDGSNPQNFPNLFNLLTGLLPDMTFRVPQAAEPQFYNSRLCQTAMHELSHASHFNKVGQNWWSELINKTLVATPVSGNPYGDGSDGDYVDVAESWAEFLGTNYALRRYPTNFGFKGATFGNGLFVVGEYYRMDNLMENEWWFYGRQWIPYGCYHDFMDNTNAAPNNPNETWDIIDGVTISDMFYIHGSATTNMCTYRSLFTTQYPNLNQIGVNAIFNRHNVFCR